MDRKKLWLFLFGTSFSKKLKSTELEPPHSEVKGEGLISYSDAITNSSRQSTACSLEFVI